jgi:hypothetical protein
VRKALWLIAGVQQGQSLNGLLGYLFEDAMHAAQLDAFVQPFRDRFPIVGTKLTPSSGPVEAISASNVVDGLALRTAWDAGELAPGTVWGGEMPAPGAAQNSVIGILEVLDDYADALGDLSIAEAVFQMVRGNFSGGALMDAMSRGSRPPMPEIVRTPRGGIDITHRVLILFAGTPSRVPAWNGITSHARALAEPCLDAWLTHLLPDPALVRCIVRYVQHGASQSKVVTLRNLDVGPLDFLYLSAARDEAQRSELENRILLAAALPHDAQNVQIVFAAGAPLPPNSITFPDALYVADKLRALIASARALAPQDATLPERDAALFGGAVDAVDLHTRATAALQSLTHDIAALAAARGGPPGPLRAALLRCSSYGVSGSIPGAADDALTGQAERVLAALEPRRTRAAQSQGVDVLTAIFGNDFVVLPRFTPPERAALQAAFAQSHALVADAPEAPDRWLRQLTHVRPAIGRLDLALSSAQALVTEALYPPAITLAQLPPPANLPDRWLALPIDSARPPARGRVAFACIAAGDPATANVYAGLLLEEWNERIPSTQENAAVAFHFDEPDARAPQALLLAVCPDARNLWDDAILQAILNETLDLAKIRTVDLASVQQVGQILPALYFALNLQGATVSTQFAVARGAGNVA